MIVLDIPTYIYINTSTYRGHIQLSVEIFVCKAAWKALVVCSPWRASSKRNTHHTHAADTHTHAHTNTHTRAQHVLKVVEASRRVAASLTAAALPSQYFIWHLNQILLVFCCHSRRRLPRTPTEAATATATELATASTTTTTTTTATLILPRLDTQTVHEYLSTCSQTLFSAHTHTRTLAQPRSVIDLCLYLANLAGESPAVNPGDASTRRMRNIRPGKHDTSCANNASARAKQSERGRERERERWQ